MACGNLDNADLLRDGSELREMRYIYTHNIHAVARTHRTQTTSKIHIVPRLY